MTTEKGTRPAILPADAKVHWVRMSSIKLTSTIRPMTPADDNSRMYTQADREKTKRFALETLMPDILSNGLWVPLVVREDNRTVVDGEARLIVLRKLKIAEVPVVWFDFQKPEDARLSEGEDARSPLYDDLTVKIAAISSRLSTTITDPWTEACVAAAYRRTDASKAALKQLSSQYRYPAKEIMRVVKKVGDAKIQPIMRANPEKCFPTLMMGF